jgi:hypothetical protein
MHENAACETRKYRTIAGRETGHRWQTKTNDKQNQRIHQKLQPFYASNFGIERSQTSVVIMLNLFKIPDKTSKTLFIRRAVS